MGRGRERECVCDVYLCMCVCVCACVCVCVSAMAQLEEEVVIVVLLNPCLILSAFKILFLRFGWGYFCELTFQPCLILCTHPDWKVDIKLPGKGNADTHRARPVHQIISMIKWIRTSRLSIKNSLSRHTL